MERRLKVLFITNWYPSRDEPTAGVFVREHAKAVGLLHEVVVIHLAGRDAGMRAPWRLEQENEPLFTDGIATYRLWRQRLPLVPLAYPSQLWGAYQIYRRGLLGSWRPDVIHAHIYAAGLPALLFGRLYGVPVVLGEHSSTFPRRALTRLDRLIARLALTSVQRVMPVSHFLQGAIEDYGIRARFQVVPNAVDARSFHACEQQPEPGQVRQMLFVGGLGNNHIKGMPYLLDALVRVRDRRSDWHLHVVGDGPYRVEYETTVEQLGLSGQVTFHGSRGKSEVADLLRRCDFLVSASLFETFGVALVEAIASGKPVIATDCGGPREIVTPEVGILVPPRDATALASAIEAMLDRCHEYPAERLAKYAAQRYSYEQVSGMLNQVYQDVLAERTAGR